MFFKIFPIRVLVNGNMLHVIKANETKTITLESNSNSISISNGYHYLPTITMSGNSEVNGIQVDTYLDNVRLFHLLLVTALLFTIAFTMDSTLMQIFANLPVLGVFAYTLIGKSKFLLLHPLDYTAMSCRG